MDAAILDWEPGVTHRDEPIRRGKRFPAQTLETLPMRKSRTEIDCVLVQWSSLFRPFGARRKEIANHERESPEGAGDGVYRVCDPTRLVRDAAGGEMSWAGLLRGLTTSLSRGLALGPQLWATRSMATLNQMHRLGRPKEPPKRLGPTEGRPQLKGVVLRTFIRKPKKPNSANRKCCRVRLSTGKEAVCFIPGEGHTLQEHHVVLVEGGRTQDLPGVKLKVVRGKYDCGHVQKK